MCGRYYIDDEAAEKLAEVIREIDRNIEDRRKYGHFGVHDYCPSMNASIIIGGGDKADNTPVLTEAKWGFSGYQKGIVINARAESLEQKKMFERPFLEGRCVIPASGFYEWNKEKQKYLFTLVDSQNRSEEQHGKEEIKNEHNRLMYLAGLFRKEEDEMRFVILTMAANQYMMNIHERMPVILSAKEAYIWMTDFSRGKMLLKDTKGTILSGTTSNEQLSFF